MNNIDGTSIPIIGTVMNNGTDGTSIVTTCHCDTCGDTAETLNYQVPAGWKELTLGVHVCENCASKVGA